MDNWRTMVVHWCFVHKLNMAMERGRWQCLVSFIKLCHRGGAPCFHEKFTRLLGNCNFNFSISFIEFGFQRKIKKKSNLTGIELETTESEAVTLFPRNSSLNIIKILNFTPLKFNFNNSFYLLALWHNTFDRPLMRVSLPDSDLVTLIVY